MCIILLSISIGYILFVINKTNVLEEYCDLIYKYFKLNILHIKEYNQVFNYAEIISSPYLTFKEFLIQHYNSFFIRMLYCPFCLAVWLSLIACIVREYVLFTLAVSYLSCLSYFFMCLVEKVNQKV